MRMVGRALALFAIFWAAWTQPPPAAGWGTCHLLAHAQFTMMNQPPPQAQHNRQKHQIVDCHGLQIMLFWTRKLRILHQNPFPDLSPLF
jgi:hypothetical protein